MKLVSESLGIERKGSETSSLDQVIKHKVLPKQPTHFSVKHSKLMLSTNIKIPVKVSTLARFLPQELINANTPGATVKLIRSLAAWLAWLTATLGSN